MAATSTPTDAASGPDRQLLGVLGRAALLGPVAALAATGFVYAQHEFSVLLWTELPERLGMGEPPWWWVVALLVTGAVLTAAALRLPGHGGHSPMDGFAFDVAPRVATSAVAAAFASLSFGAVLGPEAPALAIGTAFGAVAATVGVPRDHPDRARNRGLLMTAGGLAAFGAVIGNPLALSVFVLEAALLARRGVASAMTLAPVAVALAFGYVVQVGIDTWAGLGTVVLSVPSVEPYPSVRAVDLVLALGLGVIAATLIHLAFLGAARFDRSTLGRPRVLALVIAALGMASLALLVRQVTGQPVDAVLFSGQQALPALLAVTSVGTLVVVVIAKAAAYALALGGGFRGGPVFPAVFLGVGIGVLGAQLVESASTTGLVAAGIAAACAATIRLPFSSALLATLLMAESGLAVTTPALVGSVTGLLTVLVLQRAMAARVVAPDEAAAPAHP